jgi:hypothetical protein
MLPPATAVPRRPLVHGDAPGAPESASASRHGLYETPLSRTARSQRLEGAPGASPTTRGHYDTGRPLGSTFAAHRPEFMSLKKTLPL